MANILALDCSTKRSGYAFFKSDQIQYGAITSASTYPERRIGIMRDEIIKLIKENNIDTIVMEEVRPDGLNLRTGKLLTWLQGCIKVAIFEYDKNIKIDFIGPSSWRSKLGIQGYRIKRKEQKKKDIEYANKKYNLDLNSTQDDEADAIGILSAYIQDAGGLTSPHPLPPIGSEESAF